MKRLFAVVTPLLMAGVPPSAQVDVLEDLRQCRSIQDGSLRLQCYDSAMNQRGSSTALEATAEAASVQGAAGGWTLEETVNSLDDTPRVLGSLIASQGEGALGPITLFARCESGKIEAYIWWNSFLGVTATVVTRFDQEEPVSRQWKISTDGRGTFLPGNAIPFIAKISSAERLAVQVTPRVGSRLTAVFELQGGDDVARKVFAACRRK